MARKSRPRPAPAARFNPQPRDLLLAGIGAVSLGRKQFARAYASGFPGVQAFGERAQQAVFTAAASIDDRLEALAREAARLRKRAEALRDQAQFRFAPVLERFGVAAPAKPVRRKPARPAARRRRSA